MPRTAALVKNKTRTLSMGSGLTLWTGPDAPTAYKQRFRDAAWQTLAADVVWRRSGARARRRRRATSDSRLLRVTGSDDFGRTKTKGKENLCVQKFAHMPPNILILLISPSNPSFRETPAPSKVGKLQTFGQLIDLHVVGMKDVGKAPVLRSADDAAGEADARG
jgi:hypothetical protein